MADNGGLTELFIYGLPCVIAAGIIFFQNQQKKEKTEKFRDILNNSEDSSSKAVFDPSRSANTVSFHNEHCALSLNNDSKQILIATDSGQYNISKTHIYGFDNIVNVEIEIDGNSVASPSIGGAIVGGVLFGGAGAIVGSSNKTINQKIKNIALKLYVDDIKNPYHRLLFYSNTTAVATNHPYVVQPQKEVNEWYSRFLNIIEKRKLVSQENVNRPNDSVADELTKMSGLLKDGIISQEEFDAFKKKALGL